MKLVFLSQDKKRSGGNCEPFQLSMLGFYCVLCCFKVWIVLEPRGVGDGVSGRWSLSLSWEVSFCGKLFHALHEV
jgi:hypothetical protein